MTSNAPPILPTYKVARKTGNPGFMWSILFTVFSTLIIVMFFFTIYMGSSYLQDHIQEDKWANKIGLPNTKSIIQKWSINYLNGIDITALGPPPGTRTSNSSAVR